jgi:hypothetical protein
MTVKYAFAVIAMASLSVLAMPSPLRAQAAKSEALTDDQVIALLENAKTPADHERLASYYDEEAQAFDRQAARHKKLAATYRRMPSPGSPKVQPRPSMAPHCENIAANAVKDANEARTMAAHHRMLAKGN